MQKILVAGRQLTQEETLAVSGGALVIAGTVTNLAIATGAGNSTSAVNGVATGVAGENGIAAMFAGTMNVLLVL